MQRRTPFHLLTIAAFCGVLALPSCGGGGGGASSPDPAPSTGVAGELTRVATTEAGLPYGLYQAVDGAGNVYASVANADQPPGLAIVKIAPTGSVATLASGLTNPSGRGLAVRGMALDAQGNLYFAELYFGDCVSRFCAGFAGVVRKLSREGDLTTLAGSRETDYDRDGIGTAAGFAPVTGLALDRAGNVYVAETGSIRKITPAGAVSTVATIAGANGLAVDGAGVLFASICASPNDGTPKFPTSMVVRIDAAGASQVVAGSPDGETGSVDGPAADARFFCPGGLASMPAATCSSPTPATTRCAGWPPTDS